MEQAMFRTTLFSACALLACGLAEATPESASFQPAVEAAAKSDITRAALEAPIRFLSSDELEGRAVASRGDQLAMLYLQTQLESMGYQPAGPHDQWQQRFDVVGVKASFPKVWSFQAGGTGAPIDLRWYDDYIAGSGVQQTRGAVDN